MTDLGPGWTRAKFGDVVKLNKARVADPAAEGIERYLGIEHIKPEDLRIRSWGLVADGTTFTNYFEPGQVLFVKRRAYQRKVAVADFAGVCSGDIYVLESKDPDVLLPELLPFLCQTESFFEHAVGTSAGSLSPRTNWTQLANYEFALPPLAEQRRIAEVLWAVNTQIEACRVLAAKAKNVLSSLEEHSVRNSTASIAPLGDLLEKVIDYRGRTPKKLKMEWGNGDIPALSAMNVQMGKIDFTKITHYGSEALYERWMTQGSVETGDLIFTTEAPMGNIVRIESHQKYILSQRVVLLRPKIARISSEYLEMVVRSLSFQRQLWRYATGTTARGIRVANLMKIGVPVPTLGIQNQLVGQWRLVHSSVGSTQRRLALSQKLQDRFRELELSDEPTSLSNEAE